MSAYFRKHSRQRILAILLGLALLYAVPFFTIPGNAAGYIKIDGIDGESVDDAHKDWINLDSFQFKVEREIVVGEDGTRRASKAVLSDLVLVKEVDKSSPLLFTEAVAGSPGRDVLIHLTKPSPEGDQIYLRYHLSDILVSSLSTSGGDRLTESVGVNFPKVEIHYTPMTEDGKPGEPVSASYDERETVK